MTAELRSVLRYGGLVLARSPVAHAFVECPGCGAPRAAALWVRDRQVVNLSDPCPGCGRVAF